MKKNYEAPILEVVELGTEQSILDVSNGILTLLATEDPTSGIETLSGWGSTESWEE